MKILFSTHAYSPSYGGIETVSMLLVSEFVNLGHEVVVVTQTRSDLADAGPCRIERRPSSRMLCRLVQWCDVVFHNHISLMTAWPLLIIRRPWIVAHHIWIPRTATGLLKRFLLRYASGISVSRAIAADVKTPSVVIPNPYQDNVFNTRSDVVRNLDLVFVGRLIRAKGAHVLLQALSEMKTNRRPRLTIVGSGPEEQSLRAQANALGIAGLIDFRGKIGGIDLAALLGRHKVMVVPSEWDEPFGVVALEGMACGCVVLGSDRGGLKDAIGPAGMTFPGGDARALAASIELLLGSETLRESLRARALNHLEQHRAKVVARKYLQVIDDARRHHSPV